MHNAYGLRGVRQGGPPVSTYPALDPKLYKILSYDSRESANLRGSTRHLCVLRKVARPPAYVAQHAKP